MSSHVASLVIVRTGTSSRDGVSSLPVVANRESSSLAWCLIPT